MIRRNAFDDKAIEREIVIGRLRKHIQMRIKKLIELHIRDKAGFAEIIADRGGKPDADCVILFWSDLGGKLIEGCHVEIRQASTKTMCGTQPCRSL